MAPPKPRITTNDLETAIAWLEANEGDGGEAAACQHVAMWLEAELARRNETRIIRYAARKSGLPAKTIRNSTIMRRRLGLD